MKTRSLVLDIMGCPTVVRTANSPGAGLKTGWIQSIPTVKSEITLEDYFTLFFICDLLDYIILSMTSCHLNFVLDLSQFGLFPLSHMFLFKVAYMSWTRCGPKGFMGQPEWAQIKMTKTNYE